MSSTCSSIAYAKRNDKYDWLYLFKHYPESVSVIHNDVGKS